jgi:tetratricopeptide (TPR) repeat protein
MLLALFALSSFSVRSSPYTDSLKTSLTHKLDDSQRVSTLLALAAYLRCNEKDQKISYQAEAYDLAKKISWHRGLVNSSIALGNIYLGCGNDYTDALKIFFMTDSLAKSADDKTGEIAALRSIAFCYQRMGQFNNAIGYYLQELTLNPPLDEQVGIWGNLGTNYNSIGDYNQSVNAFFNSLRALSNFQHAKSIIAAQDTLQTAGLLLNIGYVYLSMSEPDKAMYNFENVYKTGIAIKNKQLQVLGLIGIGKTYKYKRQYDLSIGSYKRALQGCNESGNEADETDILNQMANAYLGNGDIKNAEDCALKALGLAKIQSNDEQLSKVYITVGNVLIKEKAYNDAIGYLEKGLAISLKNGALETEKDAWAALSQTYEQMQKPAEAFDAYRHFITIRDSVYNIDKANAFARQELDFSYKSRLLADKLTYDKKLARQHMLNMGGLVALVLILLLVFFVNRNYRTQKKYNELLSKEQTRNLARIKAQDMVLTDIAHIQSHKVRGPVATILGLAQLFNHEDPADPINKEILEGLTAMTTDLDRVIKEIILTENQLNKERNMDSNA